MPARFRRTGDLRQNPIIAPALQAVAFTLMAGGYSLILEG